MLCGCSVRVIWFSLTLDQSAPSNLSIVIFHPLSSLWTISDHQIGFFSFFFLISPVHCLNFLYSIELLQFIFIIERWNTFEFDSFSSNKMFSNPNGLFYFVAGIFLLFYFTYCMIFLWIRVVGECMGVQSYRMKFQI